MLVISQDMSVLSFLMLAKDAADGGGGGGGGGGQDGEEEEEDEFGNAAADAAASIDNEVVMNANMELRQVCGWGVYYHAGFCRLSSTSHCFCSCSDARNPRSSILPASSTVFHCLPLSSTVSRCLPLSASRKRTFPNPTTNHHRQNLAFSKSALLILFTVPVLLTWTMGVCTALTVEPAGIGTVPF